MKTANMVCQEEELCIGTCEGDVQSIFVMNRITSVPCIFIHEPPEILGYTPMKLIPYNQPLRIEHKI